MKILNKNGIKRTTTDDRLNCFGCQCRPGADKKPTYTVSLSAAFNPAVAPNESLQPHVLSALSFEDRKAQYDRRLAEATRTLTRLGFAVTRAVYTIERVMAPQQAPLSTGVPEKDPPVRSDVSAVAIKPPPAQPPVLVPSTPSRGMETQPSRSQLASRGGGATSSVAHRVESAVASKEPTTACRVRVRVQLPESKILNTVAAVTGTLAQILRVAGLVAALPAVQTATSVSIEPVRQNDSLE